MTIHLTKEEFELLVSEFDKQVYFYYDMAPDKLQKLLAKLEVALMKMDKDELVKLNVLS